MLVVLISGRVPLTRARLILLATACCFLFACTYLENAAKQSEYSRLQRSQPTQYNLKHMLDQQTFFVYGRVTGGSHSAANQPVTLAAFSSKFISNELVDVTHVAHAETHYGLNLPAGEYSILALQDLDANGVLDQTEVVSKLGIKLDTDNQPEMVVDSIDIHLAETTSVGWQFQIKEPEIAQEQESLFYPKGTIRNLNDPLFDRDMALLGLYEPAAFLEQAPTMFYALEEDSSKAPVIFVHGIGGSAREFKNLIDALDRSRYKPWFFHYPSGSDLDQLAEMFYEIFLSGRAVTAGIRPVTIVAHSMGGLIVREALNRYQGNPGEVAVDMFISIASPFGGHPDAARGIEHSPLVVPSWRDLNPQSDFILQLFRKPLPAELSHHLLYAFGNPASLKFGANSDGVVPLNSQLPPEAQRQATQSFGFDNSHTGVLEDDTVINHILEILTAMKSPYPESHIEASRAGGFDVEFGSHYTEREKYYIRTRGKYMALLASGKLDTLSDPSLEHFVAVAQGKAEPQSDAESAWLKFIKDFPHYLDK